MTTLTKEAALALCIDDTSERAQKIQAFVMDQSQTYEDRLEVWKAAPEHLQHRDDWCWDHPTMDDSVWLLPIHPERHEEINLEDIPNRIKDYDPKTDKIIGWPPEKVKEFYLGCMNEGIWGFDFDW